jgi:hypothetical protein
MKPAMLCLALAVVIAVTACSKDSTPVDKELNIQLGDCKLIKNNNIELCYDTLIDDSRCPINSNIYCYWAGIGVAKFSFHLNSQKHTLTLATYNFGHWRKDTTVAGYTFELMELNPFPTHPAPQPPVSRSAKVRVTRS